MRIKNYTDLHDLQTNRKQDFQNHRGKMFNPRNPKELFTDSTQKKSGKKDRSRQQNQRKNLSNISLIFAFLLICFTIFKQIVFTPPLALSKEISFVQQEQQPSLNKYTVVFDDDRDRSDCNRDRDTGECIPPQDSGGGR